MGTRHSSYNANKIHSLRTRDEKELLLRKPPRDTCWLAYMIFFLHGIGHLLPWNFFITAKQYFEMKFKCPSNNSSCAEILETHFENFFSVASMIPIFLMSLLNVWLQSKIHYRSRMVGSLLVMLVFFILTTGLVGAHSSNWVNGFFALTLISVFTMNIASSLFQSSTFGFVGVLPQEYTAAVMSGQAVAGVFAALASILFMVIASNVDKDEDISTSTRNSAYGYFGTACFVLLLCLLSILILNRMEFIKYYLKETSISHIKQKQEKAVAASVQTPVKVNPSYFQIFKKVKVYAISVYLVFTVTLSFFPAFLSQIASLSPQHSVWTGTYFTPIICFLMFNISDLSGRYITHWLEFGSHEYVLLIMSCLRVLFIPAFLFCNAQIGGSQRQIPTYPSEPAYDTIPILLITLFGLSNGYLGSLAMINAPKYVGKDEKETASTIMAFFLSAGLFTGGAFSFLWTSL